MDFDNRTDLVIRTWSWSKGSRRRPLESKGFAKTRVTSQERAGLEFFPPLKIKSLAFCARMTLLLRGPKTNWIASPQFDFPEPFGPVIAVNPRSNGMVISPLKDLKFEISNACRYIPIPLIEVLYLDLNCNTHSPQDLNNARDSRAVHWF